MSELRIFEFPSSFDEGKNNAHKIEKRTEEKERDSQHILLCGFCHPLECRMRGGAKRTPGKKFHKFN